MFASPACAAVQVAVTIFPLADMVRQVGKGSVEVVTLLPSGASPHTFEPTPAQMRAVADARVFVRVGAGLDTWADKLLAARRQDVALVTVTDGLRLHGGDPHVWLDPVLVRDHLVPSISAALLSRCDPEERSKLERGAAEFREALTHLDADLRRAFASVANRNYIALHSGWRYLGERYDLHEVGVVEAFPGKEPSAQEIAAVVRQARTFRVRAILVEPQLNPRLAEQVAREFGGELLVVDPLGGAEIPERDSYIGLMRYNLSVFAKALR